MKLLTVHPGASYATADLYNGIVPQLASLGVETFEYDLESRFADSRLWLDIVWRRMGKPTPKYTSRDIIYGASKDVVERVLRWEVDGVLIFTGMFLDPDFIHLLWRAKIRTAIILTESPYDDIWQEPLLPFIDVAWTNERTSVERLRKANPRVHYLPHAYRPELHRPQANEPPEVQEFARSHDVLFVGSMFAERADLLRQVDWTGIDFGLYGDWRGLGPRSKLRQHLAGGIVYNELTAALYRRCKIGLNLYRQSIGWGRHAPRVSDAESMNPRSIELAACGTFQISHYRDEIAETFGDAVATFQSADELGHLIRYYLQHPEEREDKARRAMEAIRGHTFAERAATILRDLASAGWPTSQSEIVRWPSTTGAKGACTLPPRPQRPQFLSPA